MNIIDYIKIEFKNKMYIDEKYNHRRWKSNSDLKKIIIENNFGNLKSFDEKIWGLRNNIFEKPKCKVCGNDVKLRDQKSGFFETCSVKCGANNNIRNEKKRNTNIERYGRNGFNPIKTKETLRKKYGVDNPLQSKKIRDKIKQTCLERYNVEHPMQNLEIFEKCMNGQQQTAYKYKEYISPSGKIYKVRGYEGMVINYLIQAGITEDDLTNLRDKIPTIEYEFNGKKRKYYPDIFIRSKNMLIEVKSTSTYIKEIDKNLAKQRACKNLEYHHIIIIWDKKNNHIFEII